MKKFLIKIASFSLVLLACLTVLFALANHWTARQSFENQQTEGNLLVMHDDTNYDLLIMGISHARNFSRHNNHQRLEKMLDLNIINIGQGRGICGPLEQLFYLEYFYQRGNHVDTVLYVLSPPMMYSPNLPRSSGTFRYEPLRFDFLWSYLWFDGESHKARIIEYFRSKTSLLWLSMKPEALPSMDEQLSRIDSVKMQAGFDLVYDHDDLEGRFEISCDAVERSINLANRQDAHVILLIPPAVFGKWPKHAETLAFAHKLQQQYDVSIVNHADSVKELSYYYDHHHLNTKGIEYYVKAYLRPLFPI